MSKCINTSKNSFHGTNQRPSVESHGYKIIHCTKLIVGNVNKYSKSILWIHEFY